MRAVNARPGNPSTRLPSGDILIWVSIFRGIAPKGTGLLNRQEAARTPPQLPQPPLGRDNVNAIIVRQAVVFLHILQMSSPFHKCLSGLGLGPGHMGDQPGAPAFFGMDIQPATQKTQALLNAKESQTAWSGRILHAASII